MSEFKDTNYINIQGWMITRLGLSGNELICYAIVYGMSQDGESEYTGSLSYLESATGTSRSTCQRILKSLVEKELIVRHEVFKNNVMFPSYRHNSSKVAELGVQNDHRVSEMNRTGGQNELGGVSKMTPNNEYTYKRDNEEERATLSGDPSKTTTPLSPRRGRKSTVKAYENPPTLDEVRQFASEHCPNVNADYFFEYYTLSDKPWFKSNGEPVIDWKRTMLTWNRKTTGTFRTSTEDEQLREIERMTKENEDEIPF